MSDELFPRTADEVLNVPRKALVAAVDAAEKRVESAEEKLRQAQAVLDEFDRGIDMQKRELQQAIVEARRDARLAMERGADPETGEV